MIPEIGVIDYGCGNIQSHDRALKRIDVQTIFTSNSEVIKNAEKIIKVRRNEN